MSGPSVVVADGRQATSWTGANGAMGASGVVLDVFGDGEPCPLTRARGSRIVHGPVRAVGGSAGCRATASGAASAPSPGHGVRRPLRPGTGRATVGGWGPRGPTTTDDVDREHLGASAAANTLAIGGGQDETPRVVVGVDGSPLSMAAVTRAAQVASARG